MADDDSELTSMRLAEERLRLEREALAVERERLAAARVHAEAEARLAAKARHPFLVYASVTLLALFAFLAGLLTGAAHERAERDKAFDQAFARALPRMVDAEPEAESSATNGVAEAGGVQARLPARAHRNVSFVLIH